VIAVIAVIGKPDDVYWQARSVGYALRFFGIRGRKYVATIHKQAVVRYVTDERVRMMPVGAGPLSRLRRSFMKPLRDLYPALAGWANFSPRLRRWGL